MSRPRYHYRPEANWINDPNGLCQVDGWYHLFFQHNPDQNKWGNIHWGHARSRDLLHWETLPIAMFPAQEKGEIHCFSGSCCKDETGRPVFFYTSIGTEEAGRDCRDGAQQWMAYPADADMTRLVQSDAHALTDRIHGGFHVREWRDPSVCYWQGQYLMVLGGCLDGRGCALLYTSPDMQTWTFRHVLAQAEQADGIPWECPNFFPLDGKFVLFYSPCAQVMARVGTLDEALRFHTEWEDVLDPAAWQGYYAPQAFTDEAGRCILLGWMPECDGALSLGKGWSGVMSLPRVLHVEQGRLVAYPLETIYGLAQWHQVQTAPGTTCLAEDGAQLLVRLRETLTSPITLHLFSGRAGEARLTLTPEGLLTLDRTDSSTRAEISCTAITRRVNMPDSRADMFLALDGSTVECCVNGQWLSGRVYPEAGCCAVRLACGQPVTVQVGQIK